MIPKANPASPAAFVGQPTNGQLLQQQGDENIEAYPLRLTNHIPAVTPEPNPNIKRLILAANEMSAQNMNEKATAKTKNRIDRPIR
jgi:hypothetical protein